MMKITKTQYGSSMEIALEGRLDTESAPQLEAELKEDGLSGITKLTFDFSKVEYITSAGLRVLLKARSGLKYGGELVVANTNELVREVFNVTGIASIITVT